MSRLQRPMTEAEWLESKRKVAEAFELGEQQRREREAKLAANPEYQKALRDAASLLSELNKIVRKMK